MRIHRYPVEPNEAVQRISVSKGARLVHIGPSREGLSIWVEVDPDVDPDHLLPYMVVGTGWDIPDGWEHVATDCGETGWVWHLYREASK